MKAKKKAPAARRKAVPIDNPLHKIDRWLNWKAKLLESGKTSKVPCDARGIPCSVTAAASWRSHADAVKTAKQMPQLAGVGFVFNGDGIAGIDLDNALEDDGAMTSWAAPIAEAAQAAGAYIERSPSGRGLHIIGRTSEQEVVIQKNGSGGVEFYSTARFFTFTGEGAGNPNSDITPAVQLVRQQARKWREKGSAAKPAPHTGKFSAPAPWTDTGMSQAREALRTLDPGMVRHQQDDPGPSWLKVGMSIHDGTHGSAAGFQMFHDWSRGGMHGGAKPENYGGEEDCREQWDSIKPGGGTTRASLFHFAKLETPPQVEARESEEEDRLLSLLQERGRPLAEVVLRERPKGPDFVWQHYMSRGTVTIFSALGGRGKSQIALAHAIRAACGLSFLNARCHGARAWYVSLEDAPEAVQLRIHDAVGALVAAERASDSKLHSTLSEKVIHTRVIQNLRYVDLYGHLFRVAMRVEGELMPTHDLDTLAQYIEGEGGADVVYIDTMVRSHAADENSNEQMAHVLVNYEGFARRLGAGVGLLVHVAKASGDDNRSSHAARGAGAITDCARSAVNITPATEADVKGFINVDPAWLDPENPRLLRITHGKSNYAGKAAAQWVLLREGWAEQFTPERSQQSEEQRRYNALRSWWVEVYKEKPLSSNAIEMMLDSIQQHARSKEGRRAWQATLEWGHVNGYAVPAPGAAKGGNPSAKYFMLREVPVGGVEAVEPRTGREFLTGEWRDDGTPRGLLIRYMQVTAANAAQCGKPWEMPEEAVREQASGLVWEGVIAMLRDEYDMVLVDGVFRKVKPVVGVLPESSNRELLTGEYLEGDGPEADVRRYVESRLLVHRRSRKPLNIRIGDLQQLAEKHGLDFTRLLAQLADNYQLVQRGDVLALEAAGGSVPP